MIGTEVTLDVTLAKVLWVFVALWLMVTVAFMLASWRKQFEEGTYAVVLTLTSILVMCAAFYAVLQQV